MSDTENIFGFSEEEDDLDIAAIFGSNPEQSTPEPPAPEPPQPIETEAPPVAEPTEPAKPAEPVTPATPPPPSDDKVLDLFSALNAPEQDSPKASEAPETEKQPSVFDKPPVFAFAGIKEVLEDRSMTFEELRIAKSYDLPELGESKNVTWSVVYGNTRRIIKDPDETIISVKKSLEQSKDFLDELKNSDNKSPDCLVKPKVFVRNKGIASYKGVFPSVEAAKASDKVICLIPAQDGKTYELRKTEMGDFIAPKNNIVEFADVRAGFVPALPRIPQAILAQIISFFRSFMSEEGEVEALVHLYWDKDTKRFIVFVPQQKVSKDRIEANLLDEDLPEERYIHYADIHSHNSMPAVFSPTDDKDEQATQLYLVIGCLDRFYPVINARISCGGVHHKIDPALVLEGVEADFPAEWRDRVVIDHSIQEPQGNILVRRPRCRASRRELAV